MKWMGGEWSKMFPLAKFLGWSNLGLKEFK